MAAELDMLNRDPNGLNSHLGAVAFEEVLGEPDGVHSMDFVWNCSFKCFEFWKKMCYMLATLLCGCCIACYWGCVFSSIAFNTIWILTPGFRVLEIVVSLYKKVWGIFVDCMLDPIFMSAGNIFHAFKK